MRVDDNKTELFGLLAQEVRSIEAAGKDVYSTYGSQVVSNTARESLEDLQSCNHEEADTQIFLHVLHAVKQHRRIMIRTIDTDVFVLAVSQMQRIPQKEIWLAFGMESCLTLSDRMADISAIQSTHHISAQRTLSF